MEELAEEVCIVQMQVQAVAVCLEVPLVQGLDLSRHMLVQVEAVCSR